MSTRVTAAVLTRMPFPAQLWVGDPLRHFVPYPEVKAGAASCEDRLGRGGQAPTPVLHTGCPAGVGSAWAQGSPSSCRTLHGPLSVFSSRMQGTSFSCRTPVVSRELLVLSWAPFTCLPAQALVFLGEGHTHGLSPSRSSSPPPTSSSLSSSLSFFLSNPLLPLLPLNTSVTSY